MLIFQITLNNSLSLTMWLTTYEIHKYKWQPKENILLQKFRRKFLASIEDFKDQYESWRNRIVPQDIMIDVYDGDVC